MVFSSKCIFGKTKTIYNYRNSSGIDISIGDIIKTPDGEYALMYFKHKGNSFHFDIKKSIFCTLKDYDIYGYKFNTNLPEKRPLISECILLNIDDILIAFMNLLYISFSSTFKKSKTRTWNKYLSWLHTKKLDPDCDDIDLGFDIPDVYAKNNHYPLASIESEPPYYLLVKIDDMNYMGVKFINDIPHY